MCHTGCNNLGLKKIAGQVKQQQFTRCCKWMHLYINGAIKVFHYLLSNKQHSW